MHYANGREAKVGDLVIGKTYNQPLIIAGTLVSLTPGPDNCSAQVQWDRAVVVEQGETAEAAMMRASTILCRTSGDGGVMQVRPTQNHGNSGSPAVIAQCRDYTHAGNLLHAEDAHSYLSAAIAVLPKR